MTIIDPTLPPTLAIIGSMSIWHWLIVLVVVLLLFGGGGKIPRLMKDVGTGIKSFKKGIKDEDKADDETADDQPPKQLDKDSVATTNAKTAETATENKTTASS